MAIFSQVTKINPSPSHAISLFKQSFQGFRQIWAQGNVTTPRRPENRRFLSLSYFEYVPNITAK